MSTYTPIASQTLSSTASSITFAGVPQGYTDLVLVIQGIYTSTGNNWAGLQFNSDTSTTYSSARIIGDGGSISSARNTNDNYAGRVIMTSAAQSQTTYHIQNYSNTTTYKTCLGRFSGGDMGLSVGLWRSYNAITSITIVNIGTTFESGATFSLYGIQSGNALATKATGGNIIVSDGTYWYHAFTSSGSFIPTQSLTCDYLVVAGGASGCASLSGSYVGAGGGGAGGYRSFTSQSFTTTPYTITVGSGGSGIAVAPWFGSKGSNSSLIGGALSSIASGGGTGGFNTTNPAISGGSGGGGGDGSLGASGNIGGYSPAEGTAGGDGSGSGSAYGGGGGGGATGGGGNGSSSSGGAGGTGSNSLSSWASATGTGVSGYYAGGGGGGNSDQNGSNASGGAGGGGNGGVEGYGFPAKPNTGSGGGGGGTRNSPAQAGGNGGSGIVIVRYAV